MSEETKCCEEQESTCCEDETTDCCEEDTCCENVARFSRVLESIVEHGNKVEVGLAEEHPSATHYMRGQLNRALLELAKCDPLVSDMFPPVPEDTGIADVAVIATQVLDFIDRPESITGRTKKVLKHGLNITGENVSVCLSDLADFGVTVRDKVAEALDTALHPSDPKDDEEAEARIEELEAQIKEAAAKISKDAEAGYKDSTELARLGKELARLQLRKARKAVGDAVDKVKEKCDDKCDDESDKPEDAGE